MAEEESDFIAWREMFSVGIPFIDAQHQELFKIINDFHAAVTREEVTEISTRILTRLIAYTQEHFHDEEEVLELMRYPRNKLEAHKLEHERLMEEIFSLKDNFESGKIDSIAKVEKFLQEWLAVHILKNDKMYEPYAGEVRNYKKHAMRGK